MLSRSPCVSHLCPILIVVVRHLSRPAESRHTYVCSAASRLLILLFYRSPNVLPRVFRSVCVSVCDTLVLDQIIAGGIGHQRCCGRVWKGDVLEESLDGLLFASERRRQAPLERRRYEKPVWRSYPRCSRRAHLVLQIHDQGTD